MFVVENRFYDVLFELSKDPVFGNGKRLDSIVSDDVQLVSIFFDFYNSYSLRKSYGQCINVEKVG